MKGYYYLIFWDKMEVIYHIMSNGRGNKWINTITYCESYDNNGFETNMGCAYFKLKISPETYYLFRSLRRERTFLQ